MGDLVPPPFQAGRLAQLRQGRLRAGERRRVLELKPEHQVLGRHRQPWLLDFLVVDRPEQGHERRVDRRARVHHLQVDHSGLAHPDGQHISGRVGLKPALGAFP